MRIVTAKPPKKHLGGPVQRIGGVQEPEPLPERPRIGPRRASARCRTSTPRSTSGAAMPPKRCFENSCAGPRAMAGRKHPERYWRRMTHYLPAPRRCTNRSPCSRHGSCGSDATAVARTACLPRRTSRNATSCCGRSSSACATMDVATEPDTTRPRPQLPCHDVLASIGPPCVHQNVGGVRRSTLGAVSMCEGGGRGEPA